MYITQIDIEMSGERRPTVVHAKQGDVAARQVEIKLLDHTTEYQIPDGATARIWIQKPDGKSVFNDATISENRVIADLTAEALAAYGCARAEISLYQGEQLLSSSVFHIDIERNARNEGAAEGSDQFGALDQLLAEAGKAIPAANEAAERANDAAQGAEEIADEVRKKLEAGEFVGATGPQGPQGIQGTEGPQGERGDSGVTVPIAGLFTLSGDADGNLWAYYADGSTPPEFETDADGNIYYIIPEVA